MGAAQPRRSGLGSLFGLDLGFQPKPQSSACVPEVAGCALQAAHSQGGPGGAGYGGQRRRPHFLSMAGGLCQGWSVSGHGAASPGSGDPGERARRKLSV